MRWVGAAIGLGMVGLAVTFTIRKPESLTLIAVLVVGVLLVLLTARGTWPDTFAVSGTGISAGYDTGHKKADVDEYAEDVRAQEQGQRSPEPTSRESLSAERLVRAQAMSPADYDDAVRRALHRVWPEAMVSAEARRSRLLADFELRAPGISEPLLVETKWRGDPRIPYRGSTLAPLVSALGTAVRLLVVANSVQSAIQVHHDLVNLPNFAVVGWIDEADDPALLAAVRRVLSA